MPAPLPIQECRLLLRSGKGDAQIAALFDAQRIACKILEQICDAGVRDAYGVQPVDRPDVFAIDHELQRTDAVPTDCAQQAVRIRALRARTFGKPPTDIVTVGQQIIEHRDNGITGIASFAQRERQRYRDGMFPC